jgi:hypothetical protein
MIREQKRERERESKSEERGERKGPILERRAMRCTA